MESLISRSWWVFAVHGAAALLFGILALLWPRITLLVFVVLFAAYALVIGIIAIVGAIRHRMQKGWWVALLLGALSTAAGVIAVFNPGLTLFVMVLLVGANAIVMGLFDIVVAIRLRKEIEGEWLLVLTGVVSIAFGALVVLFPPAGALAMVFVASFYALATGLLLLALAFRLRKWAKGRDAGRGPSGHRAHAA